LLCERTFQSSPPADVNGAARQNVVARCRFRAVLPEPMLARTDRLPRGDFAYEVKWDGFRALVSTEEGLLVRSRRGWNMTDRLPELAALPGGLARGGPAI
jgi:ATP-dependent DNA ligase